MDNFPKKYTYEAETERHSWSMPSGNSRQEVKLVKIPDYDLIDQTIRLAFIGATLSILANIGFLCLFVEQVKISGWGFSNFLLLCFCTGYYFLFVHPFIIFIRKWKR